VRSRLAPVVAKAAIVGPSPVRATAMAPCDMWHRQSRARMDARDSGTRWRGQPSSRPAGSGLVSDLRLAWSTHVPSSASAQRSVVSTVR